MKECCHDFKESRSPKLSAQKSGTSERSRCMFYLTSSSTFSTHLRPHSLTSSAFQSKG